MASDVEQYIEDSMNDAASTRDHLHKDIRDIEQRAMYKQGWIDGQAAVQRFIDEHPETEVV